MVKTILSKKKKEKDVSITELGKIWQQSRNTGNKMFYLPSEEECFHSGSI